MNNESTINNKSKGSHTFVAYRKMSDVISNIDIPYVVAPTSQTDSHHVGLHNVMGNSLMHPFREDPIKTSYSLAALSMISLSGELVSIAVNLAGVAVPVCGTGEVRRLP